MNKKVQTVNLVEMYQKGQQEMQVVCPGTTLVARAENVSADSYCTYEFDTGLGIDGSGKLPVSSTSRSNINIGMGICTLKIECVLKPNLKPPKAKEK